MAHSLAHHMRHGVQGYSKPRQAARTLQLRAAAPQGAAAPVKVDPFAEKTVRKPDSPMDMFFISIYSHKMANQLENVYVPARPVYDDFVRISKEIMKGRTPAEQKEVVLNVLNSLLPPQAPEQFRKLFPPSQMSAELNAAFAAMGFGWLVGEMELKTDNVQVSPTEVRKQRSIVKIKKCRYLESSGCVGMCVNMCKIPTESFFTNEFGLPLTMKPNFEDLSCEMIFGQPPAPPEEDAALKQPCFKLQCSMSAAAQEPCVKLPRVEPNTA